MIVLLALSFADSTAAAGVEHDRDPVTGLETWQWQGDGVSFTFTQRLPDQSRAYFQGRGFKPTDSEPVAIACVFQTIIRNRADSIAPIDLELSGWRVIPIQGSPRPPRLEADWQREWERRNAWQTSLVGSLSCWTPATAGQSGHCNHGT